MTTITHKANKALDRLEDATRSLIRAAEDAAIEAQIGQVSENYVVAILDQARKTIEQLNIGVSNAADDGDLLVKMRLDCQIAFDKYDEEKAKAAFLAQKTQMPNWYDLLIKPLAAGLQKALSPYRVTHYGPFGLGPTVSIYVEDINTTAKDGTATVRTRTTIALRPIGPVRNGVLGLVDYTTDTGQFPENSLGWLNGLNHPTIPLPDTFYELVEMIKQQMKERGRK